LLLLSAVIWAWIVSKEPSYSNEFFTDFAKSPEQVLELLAKKYAQDPPVDKLRVYQAPTDWITVQDAINLFEYVNDKTPCARIGSPHDSLAFGPSTIGSEARHLIRGFISGEYPAWNASHFRSDDVHVLRKTVLEIVTDRIDAKIEKSSKTNAFTTID